MLLEMKTSLAGPRVSVGPGDTYECGEEEAARLIERGYAVAKDEPEVENRKATPAAEAATVESKPKRRGRPPKPAEGDE